MLTGQITNAPHIPRGSAFLDSRDMVSNPISVMEKYRARLGHTFTFHFGGAVSALVSTHPDFIRHILRENYQNYQKSYIQVERIAEFEGHGLLNSHGEKWLSKRRYLQQGFRRSRMMAMMPIMQQALSESMKRFEEERRENDVIDVHKQMVFFTLRLVGKSLLGNSMKEEELELVGETISIIQKFMVRQIVQPYKIPWFRISGQTARYQRMRQAADHFIREHIASRRKYPLEESDLLQLLLSQPFKDTGETLDDEQILIECLQLLVAGNETSSNALAWTFYLLCRHPWAAEKIRAEIAEVLGKEEPNFKNLHQLSYTMQVFDETMRLYPPFWMVDRIAMGDDEAMGIHIPKGTMVVSYLYGLHRNTDYWDDPEVFNPDRFTKERKKARNPFAHIPFGGGPRICIGNSMAIVQMLLILVALVRDYRFELVPDEPVAIRPMMILRPDGPMKMRFWRI